MTLRDALMQLRPDYRDAIVLVDFIGYDVAYAGLILSIPTGTVKSRRSRARRDLKEIMTRLDFGPSEALHVG